MNDRQREADSVLFDDSTRERVMMLVSNFSLVWNDQLTLQIERKRMVALLTHNANRLTELGTLECHNALRILADTSVSEIMHCPENLINNGHCVVFTDRKQHQENRNG